MNLIPIIIFAVFFAVILFIKFTVNKSILKILTISVEPNYEKSNVKCETYASGARDNGYAFRKCDLKFFDDAFFIIGFMKIGRFKFYKRIFIITQNDISYYKKFAGAKVFNPKKINLNSFNKDVFIECGESSFFKTNYEIRLKDLTDEEKNYIKI
ncbi:hypothetical protein [uncultured Flavobacterium sp.]|uniref:hypothetical protein n=1 Tax=uncultured Flavobacterium sp. TaxID=165435 RepID=UPI0025DDE408|nr:hypothetical protein [uncultured Flavobacterium sp.]